MRIAPSPMDVNPVALVEALKIQGGPYGGTERDLGLRAATRLVRERGIPHGEAVRQGLAAAKAGKVDEDGNILP